jgi:hypothetical protein
MAAGLYLENRMKTIVISSGEIALVDDDDYEALSQYKWTLQVNRNNRYAARWKVVGKRTYKIFMHRSIMNFPEGSEIDHINHNGLDNRKENLRLTHKSGNQQNARIRRDNKSGYKGVRWYKRDKRWQSSIMVDYKAIHLGYFDDPKAAAFAYNQAAIRYFGENAFQNII